jgi:hypothetical protein
MEALVGMAASVLIPLALVVVAIYFFLESSRLNRLDPRRQSSHSSSDGGASLGNDSGGNSGDG